MQTPANSEAKPRRKTRKRLLKLVLLVLAVVVLLVVFAVSVFVSSEGVRKIILAKINSSIDGKVDFSGLSMNWWGAVKITNFSFSDDRTSVTVKKITTKPHYGSILRGSLSFGKTELFEPRVEVNLAQPRLVRPQRPQQQKASVRKPQPIALPVKRIDMIVRDGSLKVTGWAEETIELAGINSKLAVLPLSASSGKLRFAKGSCFGLNFGPTEVDIQIKDKLLKIAPFSTTVNNGRLNFAAEADFNQKPTLLRTPGAIEILKDVQINEETTDKLLMYVNPIFADAVNVSGVANFSCERLAIPLAGATKNDLEIVGTISITQLRLQSSNLLGQILSVVGTGVRGQNITISPTRFVLRDGFIRYNDMQVVVGDNPVNFGGVIGLDKSLNMRVTLPYTAKGETARIGKEVKGERISLPLRGTIDKPELDLGRLLEEQLKQQLQQQLKEQLEGLFEK